MGFFRVLRLAVGEKVDHEGRERGRDWLIADLGKHEDGSRVHLTTNNVRASEYGALVPDTQLDIGVLLARLMNDRIDADGVDGWRKLLTEVEAERKALLQAQSEAVQRRAAEAGQPTFPGTALRRES